MEYWAELCSEKNEHRKYVLWLTVAKRGEQESRLEIVVRGSTVDIGGVVTGRVAKMRSKGKRYFETWYRAWDATDVRGDGHGAVMMSRAFAWIYDLFRVN